jgi:DNA-directed RNA polymerase specialized sigma24 family protein
MEELDIRGIALLAKLAADPENPCWKQFDALFYEIVWKYLRANSGKMGPRVARYVGAEGTTVPEVFIDEVDEVAHEATTVALRRVRQNASRFDPNRGSLTHWVIGAAEYAYVEVAKTIVKARRSDILTFVPPEDLPDERDRNPTPEEQVMRRLEDAAALEAAASSLSEREFAAVRLVVTAGYTYAEAAEVIFGDERMTRQVDGLLTRGRRKLADAWQDRRPPAMSAKSTKVSTSSDDKEKVDE